MDIANSSFKRKRKLNDFLDDSSDVKLTDNNDTGTIQPHQSNIPFLEVMIHHQFPDIALVSPLCYSNSIAYYIPSDQRIDFGTTAQAGFEIDLLRNELICALMYRLEGKHINEFDRTTYIQLVMIWKLDKFKKFHLATHLIAHDKYQIWDRDRLKVLTEHHKLFSIQHDSVEKTWLMHDITVLMTSVNVTREEECYKLDITISETNVKNDTQKPQYIDMDR
jgi:hypothetical protein